MTTIQGVLQTGQLSCYNEAGEEISCQGSGQDGELRRGLPWPRKRFEASGETVADHCTGLTWTRNGNPAEFPLTWAEALEFIRSLNRESAHGFADWRLPNRKEMRSLISYQTMRPALPGGHPFSNVFLDWYWTSTTAAINPLYAWYVHLDGARMFYGRKSQYYLLWPVRGTSRVLPATGQQVCYAADGTVESECDPVQDGGTQSGTPWPQQRFTIVHDGVLDRLTGLQWLRQATLSPEPVSWSEALSLVEEMNTSEADQGSRWRLPNINELESLVDCSRADPALPGDHPFTDVQNVYWSSTTSFFEPDWAWALYLVKGALGVGIKRARNFHLWPVRDG
jgi:hypothetical protein